MIQNNEIKNKKTKFFSTVQRKCGFFGLSIVEHRDRLASAQPRLLPADVNVTDILVPLHNNVKIPARIFRPKKIKKVFPTVFYVPGTAFIASEIKFTKVICSHIAEKAKCQVIVINHSLAPENQFPKGLLDAYKIFEYFVKHVSEEYLIDKNHLVIAGYSSGGNFATLMAMKAKENGINIVKQILVSPIVDLSRSLYGFEEYENQDKAISEEFISFFLDLYIPKNINPRNPHMSPIWEKDQKLQKLPKTDIILGKFDRFRSDSEGYYLRLQLCGVRVEKIVIEDADHSFLWHNLETIEEVAERIKIVFKPEAIYHLSPKLTFSHITQRLGPKQTSEGDEEIVDANIPRSSL